MLAQGQARQAGKTPTPESTSGPIAAQIAAPARLGFWARAALGLALWRAGRLPPATGFSRPPEPRRLGLYARGRQLCAGNIQLGGQLLAAGPQPLWDLAGGLTGFWVAAHGFEWLDDLAAVPDAEAAQRARDWSFDWMARFGAGPWARGGRSWAASGGDLAWAPDLVGRRLACQISHGQMLLAGQDSARRKAYFACLSRQARYLARAWRRAPAGLARLEALAGLLQAAMALTDANQAGPKHLGAGTEARALPLPAGQSLASCARALADEARALVDPSGAIPSRNPEELLEIFALLTGVAQLMADAGLRAEPAHLDAIERMAPVLRALRHADGGLARFHGGGRGAEGRLDQALAASGVRGGLAQAGGTPGLAMGFARLSHGRTSVLLDAAPPPLGAASAGAHAATLALELTSGRRPLVVNCGAGAAFGPEWHRASRATPSHSTLSIAGFSSSRLGADGRIARRARLRGDDAPGQVSCTLHDGEDGRRLIASHDGYQPSHGLIHVRELLLDPFGRMLRGEDTLGALSTADRRRYEAVAARLGPGGIGFDLRFHLHPDVEATPEADGQAVSLRLRSGEVWLFRHDGTARLALAPSVYLERGRLAPRPAQQIVLSAFVTDYACQIGWTLAKAQDTPAAIRDLLRDEPIHL